MTDDDRTSSTRELNSAAGEASDDWATAAAEVLRQVPRHGGQQHRPQAQGRLMVQVPDVLGLFPYELGDAVPAARPGSRCGCLPRAADRAPASGSSSSRRPGQADLDGGFCAGSPTEPPVTAQLTARRRRRWSSSSRSSQTSVAERRAASAPMRGPGIMLRRGAVARSIIDSTGVTIIAPTLDASPAPTSTSTAAR